jgi:hypothetical protein
MANANFRIRRLTPRRCREARDLMSQLRRRFAFAADRRYIHSL